MRQTKLTHTEVAYSYKCMWESIEKWWLQGMHT